MTVLLDIHSHILPAVDDGAKNLNEALKILKLMQKQGITDVIATPHFYPSLHSLEDFNLTVNQAYNHLSEASQKRNLPKIYKGCELLYYKDIGLSDELNTFCLNNSDYLLLELTDGFIKEPLFDDLLNIQTKANITPIIAHAERYFTAKKYRKFIKFLKLNNIPVQINADSVLNPLFNKPIKMLLKSELDIILASDSHSSDTRPPRLKEAYELIGIKYGEEIKIKLTEYSKKLHNEIIGGETLD
ncbi:MAG: hypothetical protein IJP34_05060 [Clostridia bacterium]|nr:hypothetical protein [Clostridia bacterium]